MSLCFVTISSPVSSVQRRSQRQSDYRNYGTDSGWTAANIGGIRFVFEKEKIGFS